MQAVSSAEADSNMPKLRLGPVDWVMAGFRALAADGPQAVRAETLARGLGATKGSFYWHFKDLAALHQAMLDAWAALATTAITTAAQAAGADPRARLLRLVDLVSVLPEVEVAGGALEPAIRDWGRVDPRAGAVLARVDRHRIAALRDLLAEAGLSPAAAEDGAVALYGALIGLDSLRRTARVAMRGPLRRVAEGLLAAPTPGAA
ncbi:TetR/AcrR family transcriptional regulator [Fuscovulum blasticum]|uniref:TetR/AcrR family transcriptional regulator n=1 Tax=Fuscovulum blasticum TaxID=1075 RepID=UPI000D3EA68D|nr:TetR/AcrR family transcriptional regulator [Fuscovulum blasticum]AWD20365.1 hypothetical protein B6K69_00765 [Fuscovulum blasticum]